MCVFFETNKFILYYKSEFEEWHLSIKTDKSDFNLSSVSNLSCFLQVFYEDPKEFFYTVTMKARAYDLDENILFKLPIEKSIIFCLENEMFFWFELSLKWLEVIPINEELKKTMQSAINSLSTPQSIKHKLQKILQEKGGR